MNPTNPTSRKPTLRTAALEVVEPRSDVAVGRLYNLVVVMWKDVPTYESGVRIGAFYKKMATDFPGGFALLVVVPEGVSPPDQRTRDLASQSMREVGSALTAAAGVFEARGMVAAALRAAMSTMALLARTEAQPRIFADVNQALAWLQPYVRDGASPVAVPDLLTFVQTLRGSGSGRD